MDFRKRLGAQLREMRRTAGLTQEGLAERIGDGCAAMTISRFERGVLDPSLTWLDRISAALDTDVDHLLAAVVRQPGATAPARRILEVLGTLDDVELEGAEELLRTYRDVLRRRSVGSSR